MESAVQPKKDNFLPSIYIYMMNNHILTVTDIEGNFC